MFKYAATIVLALPGFIFLMRFCLGAIYYASSTWNDNCLKSIPYQLSIYSCKWVDISKGCCLGILSLCFGSRGLHFWCIFPVMLMPRVSCWGSYMFSMLVWPGRLGYLLQYIECPVLPHVSLRLILPILPSGVFVYC